jgi:hypothetical protein
MEDFNQMTTTTRTGPWIILRARLTGRFVHKRAGVSKLHPTLAGAFTEASTLAKEFPGFTFSVFECIGQISEEKPLEKSPEVVQNSPRSQSCAKEKLSKNSQQLQSRG